MSDAFPIIDLSGNAKCRGLEYGKVTASKIEHGLAIYRADFERRGFDWDDALHTAEQYFEIFEEFDAELSEEIAAIALGAEMALAEIVLLNARTELGFGVQETLGSEECTSLLALPEATATGRLLHGQNWDWRPECSETAVVLRIAGADGHGMLVFCEAGQLARHGLNSKGLALTANGLETPADATAKGVPTPVVRRRMLMQHTLAEAAGVLLNSSRSASHAITISQSEGEAFCFEITPDHVFWSLPEDGLSTHANHFKDPIARMTIKDLGLLRHPESLYRDSRSEKGLRRAHGKIDRKCFEQILADDYGTPNSICRPPFARVDGARSATVASLIMEPASGRLWIAKNPWAGPKYTEYSFD
ncbi:C45 family autoproteolytic acyltransferase/hydolase [Terasakiella pusilla]|uniref:C45 family autoproteolytic acyltransferase/hydolase n=1 Tax=Terasakiella pusilla TaxID=64973 RepID=UPI003AA92097